jgi:hypothetical protein
MDINQNIYKIIKNNPLHTPNKRGLWRTILVYIVFYWIRLYHFLTGYKYPKGKKVEKEYLDEYNEKQKTLFSDSIQRAESNQNIEPVFYKKKEYMEMMEQESNPIEHRWRTRILLENTVRGNILMYYDTYKQGFSYYSDMKIIPYELLNAVAMKYTMVYRCRDFFMDETVFPDQFVSPLIKIQEEEKKEEEEKEEEKKKKKEEIETLRKNTAFVKLKSYREIKEEKKEDEQQYKQQEKEKKEEKIWVVNKFIYLGKIANFSFLQPPQKTWVPIVAKKVSYKDYKVGFSQFIESQS